MYLTAIACGTIHPPPPQPRGVLAVPTTRAFRPLTLVCLSLCGWLSLGAPIGPKITEAEETQRYQLSPSGGSRTILTTILTAILTTYTPS